MKTYATLTDADRDKIIEKYHYAMAIGATDPLHAAAIAAHDALGLSDRAWNRKAGTEAFGAALAMLVFRGIIELKPIR